MNGHISNAGIICGSLWIVFIALLCCVAVVACFMTNPKKEKGQVISGKMKDNNTQKLSGKIKHYIDDKNRLEELKGQEMSQEVKLEEGEILVEQAEIEEEVYPEKYYKEQIQMEINTIETAVTDMKLVLKKGNVSADAVDEFQERIEKYGELIEEYKNAYASNQYTSLKSLYKKEEEKISQLHLYFERKYR